MSHYSAGLNQRVLTTSANGKNAPKKKNQNIQVVVRCRPLNSIEKRSGAVSIVDVVPEKKEILVREKVLPIGPTKSFTFDRVFGTQSKQIELYKTIVLPILNEVLEGYNCTIFAYGQTGTGKTFTMEGERSDDPSISWEDDPLAGIIPRVMNQLFTELQERGSDYTVYVSFLEIYNEELIDLLGADSAENPKLNIYEDSSKKGACIISGLTEATVINKDEVYQILQQGAARRRTAATLMNAHSSRSHTLFMVTIKTKENSLKEFVKIGKFNLVDLAGSECIGRSGAHDKAAREAGSINQSLLTLGRVITALVEHKSHVPYRESKLTRLLQDSLGGRTKTSIIATISPASSNLEETLSTLDYAFRARNITNKPEINQKLSEEALVKEYAEEIQKLHRDLKASREKNGIYLTEDSYSSMVTEAKDLKEKNGTLTQEITELNELLGETKRDLASTSLRLSSTASELEKTCQVLSSTRKELEETRYKKMELEYISTSNLHVHNVLNDQANKILIVANDAVSDGEGLHLKLDRLKSVEEKNKPIMSGFKSCFEQWIGDVRADVEDTNSKQLGFLSSMHEFLDANVERVKNITSDKLSILVEDVRKDVVGLELAFKRLEYGLNKTADQIESSTVSMATEEEKNVESFMEAMMDLLTNGMKGAVDCALEGFSELKDRLNEQRIAELSNFGEFTSKMQNTLKEFVGMAEILNRGQQEVVMKSRQLIGQRKKMIGEYRAQVMAMFDKMEETDGCMEGLVNEGELERNKNFQHCMSTGEALMKEVNESKSRIEFIHEAHHTENIDKVDSIVTSVEQKNSFNELSDNLEKFCSRSTKVYQSHSELIRECTTVVKKQVTETTRGFCSKSQDLKDLVEDGVEEIQEDQTEKSNELESMVKEEQRKVLENMDSIRSWNEGCTKVLEEKVGSVNDFIDRELLRDVPTGNTPKRKMRDYPKDLAKKRKFNELRAEFKTKFYANEAWNMAIPDGDDEEEDGIEAVIGETPLTDRKLHRSDESIASIASSDISQQSSSSQSKNKENVIPQPSVINKEIRRPRTENSSVVNRLKVSR